MHYGFKIYFNKTRSISATVYLFPVISNLNKLRKACNLKCFEPQVDENDMAFYNTQNA